MIALILLLGIDGCASARGAWLSSAEASAIVREFAVLPPETKLIRAPDPGVERRVSGQEVQSIGRRHGIAIAETGGFCLKRATRVIPAADFRDAVGRALPPGGPPFRLLDNSRERLPEGRLAFHVPRLRVIDPAEGKAHWRGELMDDEGRSFPVWVELQFTGREEYPAARRDLRSGDTLRSGDIEWKSRPLLPGRSAPGGGWEGQVLRRSMRAGEAISNSAFRPPPAVSPGEPVSVEVALGSARLILEASAETGGRPGDRVIVRNPTSGKKFRASIVGRARVRVQLAEGAQ